MNTDVLIIKLEARRKDGTLLFQSWAPDYYQASLGHAADAAAPLGGIVGYYRETITAGERVLEEWDWDGQRPVRMRRWHGKRPGRWTPFTPPASREADG